MWDLVQLQLPASSVAVVFGGHLSARSRLTGIDPEVSGPAIRPSVYCAMKQDNLHSDDGLS